MQSRDIGRDLRKHWTEPKGVKLCISNIANYNNSLITEFSDQTWWPIELSGGEPLSTGPFLVSISSDGASDSNSAAGETDYVVTRLTVTNQVTSESREVTHFQFVSWPDYGVPDSALSMLTFLQRVRETQATATLNLQQGQLKTILPI